eukprot:3786631-Amphidinium_carterae.3
MSWQLAWNGNVYPPPMGKDFGPCGMSACPEYDVLPHDMHKPCNHGVPNMCLHHDHMHDGVEVMRTLELMPSPYITKSVVHEHCILVVTVSDTDRGDPESGNGKCAPTPRDVERR